MNRKVTSKRIHITEPPDVRILAQALREFSTYGYAGARMDRIAKKARVSKRMPFYYFTNKAHLFEIVLEEALQIGKSQEPNGDAIGTVPFWSLFHMNNPHWGRLLGWEGLEWRRANLPRVKKRRTAWKKLLKELESSFDSRTWAENLDPFYVMFGLIAVELAPVILPNLAYTLLGEDVNSPTFKAKWVSLVSVLGAAVTKKKSRA